MVKRNEKIKSSEIEKLNEKETLAVAKYISTLLTKRISKSKEINDDLIVSLSDAHENKRARQVFEWEKLRRQNVQRTA